MCWLSRKGCRNGGPVPPPSPVRRETLGMAVGFVGVVCFAGTLPAMRLAVPYLDPWFLTSARAAIAGVIASVALLVMRRRPPPLAQWHAFAIASACLVWGFPLFSAIAMVTVPASNGGVILGILPLGTAIAAAFVVGERPSSGFWLAAAAGTAIVIAFSLRQNSGGLTLGDVLLLLTVVAGSVGYAYGGKLSVSSSGWGAIAWPLVLSLPIDRKEQLMEMAPEIYFQTDHYVGWPALPLRIGAIGDEELQQRLIEAWQYRAPKKILATFG